MKSVCVFCGASVGRQPVYREAAWEMGRLLAERELTLVYGGGNVGLMGVVADGTLAHGGKAVGIIPDFLASKEIAHPNLTELYIVQSMHERKAKMAELADAFVAMPGGYGTLEELFEVITWAQLGLHCKPFGLLNTLGYYDRLVQFIDHAVTENFIHNGYRSLIIESADPAVLLAALSRYQPPPNSRWEGPDEETVLKKF